MNLYDLENSKNSRKSGISKKKETEFHAKLDTLVHDTFGKRKEELEEANPHNFDSDVDYYAAQNAPAKPRYRGTSSPGVNQDDEAYFREIFRKKRLAAQQAEKDKELGVAEGSEDFKARLEKRRATLTPAQKAASEKIMKKTANGRGISNKELDDFRATQNKQGVAESYPKHQDLSGISTDKLKAYLDKQSKQQVSGEGTQVKRVRAELQRRQQGVAEAQLDELSSDTLTSYIAKSADGTDKRRDGMFKAARKIVGKGNREPSDRHSSEKTAEGQLNEYLVRAGMPVKDVLALNLFQDTGPDGQEGMADDPRWSRLMKKYQPIANMLAKKIMALGKNRRLSDAEAEAIEQTWYDGSDAYDDMEVEYLADYYDQQIDIIEALLAGNITDEEFGIAEGEEMGTFAALKDWQVWNVHVYNNYYRGKYADYGPRPYSVVAGSPEEARQVIINNPDYVLQDLLSRKLQNGKKILPRGSALPVEEKRVGKAEPGSITTMGLKKMLTPDGVQSFKFTNGKIVDGSHAQGGEEHGNGVDEFKRQALLPANKVAEGDDEPALSELSNELLGRYKKELGVRASAADKAGDYDKGHEYFKKINKATVRQGENDARKHEQDDMMETRLDMMRRAGYDL